MALDDGLISWARGLTGQEVGPYVLEKYVAHGRIGVVFVGRLRNELRTIRAVKLTFGKLPVGWQNELLKVEALSEIGGVVHLHDLGHGQILMLTALSSSSTLLGII